MLDAIYHMTLKLLLNRVFVRNHDRSLLLHTVILSFENFAKPLRKVYFCITIKGHKSVKDS